MTHYKELGGASTTPHVFNRVLPKFVDLLKDARAWYPNLRIAAILAAAKPPIAYNKARLGPPGSCLDFLMFGKCMAPGCSYKHDAVVKVEPAQAEKAHQSMHNAYEAYKLENPGT